MSLYRISQANGVEDIVKGYCNENMSNAEKLVQITEEEFQVKIELPYATPHNLAHRVVYLSHVCFIHQDAAVLLKKASQYAIDAGLRLKVFDAYRPQQAQEIFWNALPNTEYIMDPKKGSHHTRGVAVDLTLYDPQTQQELDMGTAFDETDVRSYPANPAVGVQCYRNRLLLSGMMTRAGFVGITSEWWHFQLPNAKEYPLIVSHPLMVVAPL